MVRISRKCEYALRAVFELATVDDGRPVKTHRIAAAQNIPIRFLEVILNELRHAGIVESRRGNAGGYMLARPPANISLAEVIRLMDGALAPTESVSTYFFSHTPLEKEAGILGVLREIRDYISNRLEKVTLADLV